jgi:gas vesicle protein
MCEMMVILCMFGFVTYKTVLLIEKIIGIADNIERQMFKIEQFIDMPREFISHIKNDIKAEISTIESEIKRGETKVVKNIEDIETKITHLFHNQQ